MAFERPFVSGELTFTLVNLGCTNNVHDITSCLDLGDSLPESKRRLLTLSLPPLTRRLVFEKQKVFLRNIWMVSTISVVSG